MTVSAVSGQNPVEPTQAVQSQPPASTTPAQEPTDSVQLSPTAMAQLKGGDGGGGCH